MRFLVLTFRVLKFRAHGIFLMFHTSGSGASLLSSTPPARWNTCRASSCLLLHYTLTAAFTLLTAFDTHSAQGRVWKGFHQQETRSSNDIFTLPASPHQLEVTLQTYFSPESQFIENNAFQRLQIKGAGRAWAKCYWKSNSVHVCMHVREAAHLVPESSYVRWFSRWFNLKSVHCLNKLE